MMNYNALLRKRAEDKVKKQEKELAFLQEMATLIKEQLTALMVEEMSLHSVLRNIKESEENDVTAGGQTTQTEQHKNYLHTATGVGNHGDQQLLQTQLPVLEDCDPQPEEEEEEEKEESSTEEEEMPLELM